MANEGTMKQETLVLSDRSGNFYAIPKEDLERYRVTDERKAEIQQRFGGEDVTGHAWADGAGLGGMTVAGNLGGGSQYATAPAEDTMASEGHPSQAFDPVDTMASAPGKEDTMAEVQGRFLTF